MPVAWGLARREAVRPRGRALPILVVVGLLIATANISFASATTLGYLSIVAVLGWLYPAVTIVWARAVLRERLRPLQVAAAVLVFAGIVLHHARAAPAQRRNRDAVRLALRHRKVDRVYL